MPDMDGTSKPPQISEMFQKFALAFKTKTFEFFADEEVADENSDGFALLDSAEEIITGQKVVVIKPDQTHNFSQRTQHSQPQQLEQEQIAEELHTQITPSDSSITQALISSLFVKPDQSHNLSQFTQQSQQQQQEQTVEKFHTQIRPTNTHITHTLISSLFATISSFEASYLQLQTAHVPFVEENIRTADRAAVSHLQKLSEFKQFYRDFIYNPKFDVDFSIGSCLEAQVEENQSKLRTLGTISNRLQSEMDVKDAEVSVLRQELDKIQKTNAKLSKRLSQNSNSYTSEVLLSVRVYDSLLQDTCRSIHKFTKLLIDLMNKAKWDLNLAANSVHTGIDYAKNGHNRYAFLSYVCLVMFKGFDLECFGLSGNEIACNGNGPNSGKNGSLRHLVEHVLDNPIEVLSRNPGCNFSKFCEKKYQELIHPTMESSIFSNLDRNEMILNSWRSLSVFYESFVNMASSIWMLHKLGFSFDPVVEIFQVERGIEFSMVYMEDVTKRSTLASRTRAKVGFTVVPGFKIGKTIIQSQVYLTSMKCTE